MRLFSLRGIVSRDTYGRGGAAVVASGQVSSAGGGSGSGRSAADVSRVVVRPMGTPLPLGFLGLFAATLGFSALQLGWLPPEQGRNIALGVLALTVPTQLVAALYGFLARDPVAGTGMGVLFGTWGAAALVTLTSPPGAHSAGLGVLFLAAVRDVMTGSIDDELANITHEAGVRKQL